MLDEYKQSVFMKYMYTISQFLNYVPIVSCNILINGSFLLVCMLTKGQGVNAITVKYRPLNREKTITGVTKCKG